MIQGVWLMLRIAMMRNIYILFGDTLLKHLKKVKGDKEQFKWTGDLQQLKDFTTLILNVRGTWKTLGLNIRSVKPGIK